MNSDIIMHDELPGITLRDISSAFIRNLWVIGVAVAVGLGAAVLYTSQQERVYGSEATLQFAFTGSGGGLLSPIASASGMGVAGAGRIETDLSILKSRRIAEAVTDSLALHVRVTAPELTRGSIVSRVDAPRDAAPGTWELRRLPDGSYSVHRMPDGPSIGRAAPGEALRLGGATLTLDRRLRQVRPPNVAVSIVPFVSAAHALRGGLDITQPNPKAQVVSIRYLSTDPELAALVPNTVAESFIQYRAGTSKTESRSTVGFLREQVAKYEGQVREAEALLRAFREGGQIVSLSDEASEQVTRLADLQAKRDELQVERESLQKLLTRTQAGSDGSSPLYRELAAFPVFFSNRAVQDILQSLTKLEDERATLAVRRTEANPDVAAIDRRIRELELQLVQTARSYLGNLNNQIGSLDGRLAQFRSQMERVPGREIEFARLARQQKLLEEIYTQLHSRLKEAELQEAVQRSDVSILDAALVPGGPLAPRPVQNMMFGCLLGLLIGSVLAGVREALDSRVRSRNQVAFAVSGRPLLGMIPGMDSASNGARALMARIPVPVFAGGRRLQLPSSTTAQSSASEAFRALRTTLLLNGGGQPPRVIAVTSASSGDGKSTSALQLAISFAQQSYRTVLVDADLRAGKLHQSFGFPQEAGLAAALSEGAISLDEVIRTVQVSGPALDASLDLLPGGAYPTNPSELLGGPATRVLVDELRSRYDVVILDLPSAGVVDTALAARLADVTLFVMRYGVSHQEWVRRGIERLEQLGVYVHGVVLNDVPFGTSEDYGAYGAPGANRGAPLATAT